MVLSALCPVESISVAEGIPRDVHSTTRLLAIVEYDGGRYAGSQWQPNVPTIQDELEKALFRLFGKATRVDMSGRTDAGVHARGQVVAFNTLASMSEKAIEKGLNYFLPEDIAVKSVKTAWLGFDPRRHATCREYEYLVNNSPSRSPLWKGRALRVPRELDVELMHQASQVLLGEHDFASFTTGERDSEKATVRYVSHVSVRRDEELVTFRMIANSFLLHQVRNTVGALLRVGLGKMTPEGFKCIMNNCEYGLAGPTVPGYALYLNKVSYDDYKEGF